MKSTRPPGMSISEFVDDFMARHHLKNQPAFGAFFIGKGRKVKAQYIPWLELVVQEWQDYLREQHGYEPKRPIGSSPAGAPVAGTAMTNTVIDAKEKK